MRSLSPAGRALGALAVAALTGACDDLVSTSPSPPDELTFAGIQISGPDQIAPGQSARFTATIQLSDGSLKQATADTGVQWSTQNESVLRVDATGLATGQASPGETRLTAFVAATPGATSGLVRQTSKSILVLPDGTFRLTGVVRDAEFPSETVAGARVEITPGNLVATTNLAGAYALYGVPSDLVQIRVSRDDYQPVEDSVRLTGHATRDYELAPSRPRLQLTGAYTLTLEATGVCTGLVPENLRRRQYDAVLAQTGTNVEVVLTEARFRVASGRGNRFGGRAEPAGARFSLTPFNGPDDPVYPSVAEQFLADLGFREPIGVVLVPHGSVVATGSADGVSGTLDGDLDFYDDEFFPFVGVRVASCPPPIQFTLTAQ